LGLRALLIAIAIAAIAGCSSSAPSSPSSSASASQSGSPLPSSSAGTSPGATVDEAFCGTIGDLESKLQDFEAIKLKAVNKAKIKPAADNVSGAFSAISDAASATLKSKVDALKSAIDGLSSAAENYSTNSHPDAVAGAVKSATAKLHKAIAQLRAAASCAS
jgi:hypothetical protein